MNFTLSIDALIWPIIVLAIFFRSATEITAPRHIHKLEVAVTEDVFVIAEIRT
jgi:hypothetical protein